MKTPALLTLLWLSASLMPAMAQTSTQPVTHYLSAKQAADLALKQRIEIANAKLDVANQAAYNKEITGMALPQIAGTMGLGRNFNIPVTVLPDFISPTVYGVLEKENVKDGNGNPIKWDGVINTFPAQFGVPWQASVGVSVQQLLFQPDVFIGLKARSTALELYENQLKVAEDSVKSNVLRAYYGLLIARKGIGFAEESRIRLQKLYDDQVQLYKSGFIEALDIDKTKVNLNNITATVDNLTGLVEVSYAALKYALGLPQRDSLVLTDSLTMELIGREVFQLEDNFKYENRSEILTLQTSDKLLEMQVKRYKLNALPTIGAFWNMQTNAQRQRFNFFDTDDRWFFSNVAGLNMNIPIFTGMQRVNKVKQAEIALEQNRNTVNLAKQGIDLQIASSRTQFANAYKALQIQEENKQLAERVYNGTKTKYERGLGSSFEVLQSETSLQDALSTYYQSMYNAVVAKISYLRALGQL